ncbi:MAG: 50S ribosomal protein L25 [bacterium]
MLNLSSKLREKTGSQNNKFRKEGFIPAILYGKKIKNLPLLVRAIDFERLYKEAGESTLINLKIKLDKDEEQRVVLIHDIAKDPISSKIIHIDFNQVKMDELTIVEVPLVFIGESDAVEREEGVLIKSIQSVEVEALPQNLPHEIEVDISCLKTFEDNIYIKDLKIPSDAKIIANSEDVVASVTPPRSTEELEGLEEVPVEEVENIEVEEKGKEDKEVESVEEKSAPKQEESKEE